MEFMFFNLGEFLVLTRRAKFSWLNNIMLFNKTCRRNYNVGSDGQQIDCLNWYLPEGIMETLIIPRLEVIDHARIRFVCKSWRQRGMEKVVERPPQLPWLLLPTVASFSVSVSFSDMFQDRVYTFHLPTPLQGGWILGCSKGWIMVGKGTKKRPHTFLFNPITRAYLRLPSITTIPFYFESAPNDAPHSFINKLELSSGDVSNCMVCARLNDCRAPVICKIGDERWVAFHQRDDNLYFIDILFSRGDLYALTCYEDGDDNDAENVRMELVDCQLSIKTIPLVGVNIPPQETVEHVDFIITKNWGIDSYLVESENHILIVSRILNRFKSRRPSRGKIPKMYFTSGFQVYEVNDTTRKVSTCSNAANMMKNQVLFVGYSNSFALATDEIRGSIKGNSVYFLDHNNYLRRDSGVFCFDDGSIKRSYPGCDSINDMSWFTPSLL